MKVYLCLPINSREEESLELRKMEAMDRALSITEFLLSELHPVTAINPLYIRASTYEEFITKCLSELLKCDVIFIDKDTDLSRRCRLEKSAAMIYEKQILTLDSEGNLLRLQKHLH